MRRLFLVRHAKAKSSVGRDDYARKLTSAVAPTRSGSPRRWPPATFFRMFSSIPARRGPRRRPRFSPPNGEAKSSLKRRLGFTTRPSRRYSTARGRSPTRTSAWVGRANPGLGELATALAGSGAEPELHRLAAKYPTGAVAAWTSPSSDKKVERNRRCSRFTSRPRNSDRGGILT